MWKSVLKFLISKRYKPIMYILYPFVIFLMLFLFLTQTLENKYSVFILLGGLIGNNFQAFLLFCFMILVLLIMVLSSAFELNLLEKFDDIKLYKRNPSNFVLSVIIYAVIPVSLFLLVVYDFDIWIINIIYIVYTLLDVVYRQMFGMFVMEHIHINNRDIFDKHYQEFVIYYNRYPAFIVFLIRLMFSCVSILFYYLSLDEGRHYFIEFSYYVSIFALCVNEIIMCGYRARFIYSLNKQRYNIWS